MFWTLPRKGRRAKTQHSYEKDISTPHDGANCLEYESYL